MPLVLLRKPPALALAVLQVLKGRLALRPLATKAALRGLPQEPPQQQALAARLARKDRREHLLLAVVRVQFRARLVLGLPELVVEVAETVVKLRLAM
jgi:hypothetical protein